MMDGAATTLEIMCNPAQGQEIIEAESSTDVNKVNTQDRTEKRKDKSTTSNEYVLNVAFFSFFGFMTTQIFFALMAKSQSMLTDSLAMSVDSFTYLFNLAAERLKHRSPQNFENLSLEEMKRRKKTIRLYLEFIPPVISVTALLVVSAQALIDAITTITNRSTLDSSEAETEEPNIKIMLVFSTLNLGLDFLNVFCFSRVQDFSLMGELTVKHDEGSDDEEIASKTKIENVRKEPISPKSSQQRLQHSPSKVREFPPSIIVETSIDLSFESNSSGGARNDDENTESDGLLGIGLPNYGSERSDAEWGDELSLGVVNDGGSQSDGLTTEVRSTASAETSDSLGSGVVSASSHSNQSRRSKTLEMSIGGDGLDDISEGVESSSDVNDALSEASDENSSNDSETSGRGFNMNMCSAYTHVMADTMRSIAVLVAAGISYFFHVEPALVDATAAVIVSVIIALSLGPLVLGLIQTWNELQALKKDQQKCKDGRVHIPWMEQYQHLPSVSPRIY